MVRIRAAYAAYRYDVSVESTELFFRLWSQSLLIFYKVVKCPNARILWRIHVLKKPVITIHNILQLLR